MSLAGRVREVGSWLAGIGAGDLDPAAGVPPPPSEGAAAPPGLGSRRAQTPGAATRPARPRRDAARGAAERVRVEDARKPGEATVREQSAPERGASPGEEGRWPGAEGAVREGLDPSATAYSSPPTQEDQYWGRLASGTEEDYYWRRLSDNWYQKDVIPSTYLEIHNACYEAYNANPLANYIVEITTNFVLGNGISITAASRRVQKVIDAFWRDPDNHMETRVYDLCTELSLYGEQFIRFFVNPYSGQVKIAQIDPSMIDQIETDPDNIEKILRVHRRPQGPGQNVWSSNYGTVSVTEPDAPPKDVSTLATIADDDPAKGEWFSVPDEVIQVAVNKVSNAKRGKSDLATLLPWLRRYKDWLTDRVRINKYKGAFLWDIALAGADKKTIDLKRMQYAYPPEPGSIIVHNESEQWSAVQPQIAADDVASDGRAIKMMIAMGAGLPEHYLSEGGNVNYATAIEMGLPTFRKFQRRQDQFVVLIRQILDRVIDEAVRAGALPGGVDRGYTVNVPELAPDDNASLATAANTMAQALAVAQANGWVSRETAIKSFFGSANLSLALPDELARIEQDRAAGLVTRGPVTSERTGAPETGAPETGAPETGAARRRHRPSVVGPERGAETPLGSGGT